METKIKNTLYRFTSFRKPELISDEKKEFFFVHHLRASESVLYATTEEAFQTKLDDFEAVSGNVKDRDTLKALNPGLYNFGVWLLQNRESVTASDYIIKKDEFGATLLDEAPSTTNEDLVWDNFIYQISRHTDENAREAAMVLLYANYILSKIAVVSGLLPGDTTLNLTGPQLKRLLQARIVRPEYLAFSATPVSTPGGDNTLANETQEQFDSALKASDSNFNISKLKKLQKELGLAAIKYYKAEDAHLKAYQAQYNEDYNDYLEALANPPEDLTAPVYNYTPLQQLDPAVLAVQLSTQSFDLFSQLQSEEILTFGDMNNLIDEKVTDNSSTVFQNKSFAKGFTILTGGFVIPNTGGGNPMNNYSYTIQSKQNASGKWYFILAIKFPGTQTVETISYNVSDDDGIIENSTYAEFNTYNTISTGILFEDGLPLTGLTEVIIDVQLISSTGRKYTLSETVVLGDDPVQGILEMGPLHGQIDLPDTEEPGGGGDPGGDPGGDDDPGDEESGGGTTEDTVPSYTKYGVTRLGIADYRRVEQTICCYVPGEVSHIENVMSREYKERSTKRLRRSENTSTTEKSTETESLTDTTSTERNELHQEMSKMQQESMDFNASAGIKYTAGVTFHADAAFSYHNNKEESNSQARTQAKELTARAMDRVVTKVREERINKIIDEFTEENKHGFDNREGNNHISGVYRWVDKIYTNEIFNYGKRLMYEFMIPEPAKFHLLYSAGPHQNFDLVKPVDPRTAGLATFKNVDTITYATWASAYNADVEAPPRYWLYVGKSYSGEGVDGKSSYNFNDFKIPEGYRAVSLGWKFNTKKDYEGNNMSGWLIIANNSIPIIKAGYDPSGWDTYYKEDSFSLSDYNAETIPVSLVTWDVGAFALNINVLFVGTDEFMIKWQIATFNKIIQAYEDKLAEYELKLAELQSQVMEERRTNPLFNRDIENMVLRKNCISYILGYDYLGKNFQKRTGDYLYQHSITPNAVNDDGSAGISLIEYASMAKFIEQAFEWEIMSYIFYPFYWGTDSDWETLYGGNADDTLFAKFIQSGMARVIVTVRPGFEDAVNWFLNTGQIWNGMSSPPVIGDDLYLSIVEELQDPEYYVDGSWETRVPSSLTVIQAGIIGLDASGLPCECKRVYDSDGNVISGSKDEIKQYDSTFLQGETHQGVGYWEVNGD